MARKNIESPGCNRSNNNNNSRNNGSTVLSFPTITTAFNLSSVIHKKLVQQKLKNNLTSDTTPPPSSPLFSPPPSLSQHHSEDITHINNSQHLLSQCKALITQSTTPLKTAELSTSTTTKLAIGCDKNELDILEQPYTRSNTLSSTIRPDQLQQARWLMKKLQAQDEDSFFNPFSGELFVKKTAVPDKFYDQYANNNLRIRRRRNRTYRGTQNMDIHMDVDITSDREKAKGFKGHQRSKHTVTFDLDTQKGQPVKSPRNGLEKDENEVRTSEEKPVLRKTAFAETAIVFPSVWHSNTSPAVFKKRKPRQVNSFVTGHATNPQNNEHSNSATVNSKVNENVDKSKVECFGLPEEAKKEMCNKGVKGVKISSKNKPIHFKTAKPKVDKSCNHVRSHTISCITDSNHKSRGGGVLLLNVTLPSAEHVYDKAQNQEVAAVNRQMQVQHSNNKQQSDNEANLSRSLPVLDLNTVGDQSREDMELKHQRRRSMVCARNYNRNSSNVRRPRSVPNLNRTGSGSGSGRKYTAGVSSMSASALNYGNQSLRGNAAATPIVTHRRLATSMKELSIDSHLRGKSLPLIGRSQTHSTSIVVRSRLRSQQRSFGARENVVSIEKGREDEEVDLVLVPDIVVESEEGEEMENVEQNDNDSMFQERSDSDSEGEETEEEEENQFLMIPSWKYEEDEEEESDQ